VGARHAARERWIALEINTFLGPWGFLELLRLPIVIETLRVDFGLWLIWKGRFCGSRARLLVDGLQVQIRIILLRGSLRFKYSRFRD
jgi:hypothetical protein